MKRLILALLLITSPAEAAVLWFAGAETGDFSEVTNLGCLFNSANQRTGSSAYECANTGHVFKSATGLAVGPTVGVRIYLRLATWSSGGGKQVFAQMPNAGDTAYFVLFLDTNSHLAWGLTTATTQIATGTTALTNNTYHLVEAKCVIDASVGGCEVKLNGTVEFTSFATNTSSVSSVDHAYFGTNTAVTADFQFDDLMICSGGYCPTGGTIARQGTSGSPTYNAWTKVGVGCSGSSIDNCWSNTPFTTTTSATSTVASDAQTMIVASFGSTQTGHGTQTIAAHDTINACKTALIAKTAVASGISIRRRLNGTDTDTAKTLTTSDAYYDDGIWTTTTDNLRGVNVAEIGAIHGTGVNLDTVEDAWLICDYASVTVPTRHRVTQ